MLTEAEFAEAVEAVRNDHEPSIPDLIAHDRAQRAEIERLRGDVRVARNELALERESYEQMHDVAIRHRQDSDKWAALAADATARAEKAEAERDELKRLHRHALDSVDQVFDEVQHPLLPDFCRVGEDKFRAVIRLANSYISERARADRYLAAMTAYVDARIADGICIAQDGESMPVAFERTELAIRAIRALVEEARRG